MGSSSSTPSYSSATVDSGNWGTSTTNKNGTTYTAPGWINDTMDTVGNNLSSTLQSVLSNDYSNDANFQTYLDNFNKNMEQSYDSDVLSQLANKGLMRSSGLQAATNSFNDTMADNLSDLYSNYASQQSSNLTNLLNTSNALYEYMTGLGSSSSSLANALSSYNYNAYNNDKNNSNWYSTLASALVG
ncbi:MAG: hypothetical protein LUH05_03955 [Candidatus Gastranaerophilales bacterium]|nr:hypothetical protein [Candidatus Gastranaerophilales bacterium]